MIHTPCVVCSSPAASNNPYPLVKVEGKKLTPQDSVCSPCDRGVIQLRKYFIEKGITSARGDSYGPGVTLEEDATLWYELECKKVVLPFSIWSPEA